jgi:hypothetical protein
MTRDARPLVPLSEETSPDFLLGLVVSGGIIGLRSCGVEVARTGSVLLRAIRISETAGSAGTGVVSSKGGTTSILGRRALEPFDGERSFRRDRTVEPGALPRTAVRRDVVFDLVGKSLLGASLGTCPLNCLCGEETGEDEGFEVVKKLNTLSATMLILALARLCDLLLCKG